MNRQGTYEDTQLSSLKHRRQKCLRPIMSCSDTNFILFFINFKVGRGTTCRFYANFLEQQKVRLMVRYFNNPHEFLNSILSIVTKKLQTLVNKNPELVDVN